MSTRVADGILYIVATPIGNLEDVTTRALNTLKIVDVVYAEDTRVTHKLLERYDIKKPMYSYREAAGGPQVQRTIAEVIASLKSGKNIAFCSDAGTPGISDPGNFLVKHVIEAGITIVPIPGASSLTAILSVAGFVAQKPLFVGFLPKKKGHQTLLKKVALALQDELCDSVVFLESPERIVKLLTELGKWGIALDVCVGRELTKLHEEILHGTLDNVLLSLSKRVSIKGEITVAIQLAK